MSDKKVGISWNGITIDYYDADVITANDYYTGGMQMPGRKYQAGGGSYRYGFGGQEKSEEIKGEGNSYTAEFWEYDPRLVRRWNVDPIMKPWESPYAAFNNNPISIIDPKGLDGEPYKVKKGDNLSKIASRIGGGATAASLAKLNGIKDPNKIKVGQSILTSGDEKSKTAALEANFVNSPFTISHNTKNSDFVINENASVKSLGMYFASTHAGKTTQENTVIVGGPLLDDIKNMPSIKNLIQKGTAAMQADGKFTAGEFYNSPYGMSSLGGPDGTRMKSYVLTDLLNGKKFTDSRFFSAEFWLGSYDFSMRVSNDGKNMILAVYDSKSVGSATDRNWFIKTILPIPNLTTTYQRYIWVKPIKN